MIEWIVFGVLVLAIWTSAKMVLSVLSAIDWILMGIVIWGLLKFFGFLVSFRLCLMLSILFKLLGR